MKKKPLCKQFAKDICDILHIDAPKIEFVPADRMRTNTQIAALTPGTILIRNDVDISPDLFLALAHELRHAYQIANGANLEEYQTSDKITVEEYNLQPLEIDANAFALLAMSSMFGIMPEFQNLSESVREAIKTRADQIKAELE